MANHSHKKHADIARPALGNFSRNEWAILGTPCGEIKKLAFQLIEALSPAWKIGYADADHKKADAENEGGDTASSALPYGASMEYVDKIGFHNLGLKEAPGHFLRRSLFNEADAVLVNGNHFTAKNQILVIDPRKEDSLRRKLDQLTGVQMILLSREVDAPFDFLKENLPDFAQIPILQLTDFQGIQSFFDKKLKEALPPLNGLVLVGGRSRRMGADKGKLDYHGLPQQDHLMHLLAKFCVQTYLSCRPDQAGELAYSHEVLPDTFLGLGPMGAILSAFRQQPGSAWFVVACDLPLLDAETLRFLIDHRRPASIATAFRSPTDQFPEPLATVWEPKSYAVLLQFLAQGYTCPRKVLINSSVHLVNAPAPQALMNVNTPEEAVEAMKFLD